MQVAVALQQHLAEGEELHLFDVPVAGEELLEVVRLPLTLRAPRVDHVLLGCVSRLGQEGQTGEREGDHRPAAELRQERAIPDQGHHVASEAKPVGDHLERAPARLLSSALEHVHELRILEVMHREPERLVEDQVVDMHRQARAQELRPIADRLAGDVRDREESELDRHPRQRRTRRVSRVGGRRDDRVDDPLPDVGDRHREQRIDGVREDVASGESAFHPPGDADRMPQVGQQQPHLRGVAGRRKRRRHPLPVARSEGLFDVGVELVGAQDGPQVGGDRLPGAGLQFAALLFELEGQVVEFLGHRVGEHVEFPEVLWLLGLDTLAERDEDLAPLLDDIVGKIGVVEHLVQKWMLGQRGVLDRHGSAVAATSPAAKSSVDRNLPSSMGTRPD